MYAVVLHDNPRELRVESRPEPSPGPGQAVIASRVVGICRSDIELINGTLDDWLDVRYPLVFGHEWSGEVVAIGKDVTRIKVGDRVTGCGALGNDRWFGVTDNGASAERFTVDASLLQRLPFSMSYEQGALIEPFACVYHGLTAIGGVDPSTNVCVLGAGTIGVFAAAAARACGAQVVVVEPNPLRHRVALQMGASVAIETATLEAVERALGCGPDLVIEAAGASTALASSLEIVASGGRVLFLGLCSAERTLAALRLIQIKNLHMRGSTGAPLAVWEPAIRFLTSATVDLAPVISYRFGLNNIADAFAAARDPAHLKVQIHLGGGYDARQ